MSLVQAASQQPILFSACSSGSISYPKIDGLNFEHLNANVVSGVSESLRQGIYLGHGAKEVNDLSFCNVSLTYHHVGHTESPIDVQVWLPSPDDWNERMMAVGGGGFAAGLFPLSYSTMRGAVSDGYVAVSTNAGHGGEKQDPSSWALDKSGEVDMHRLENFAYKALGNLAPIAKSVAKDFYGRSPKWSYWNGCSTGGRQGLAMAQRYPEAYDGILANAPAVNWAQLLPTIYWPQFVLNNAKEYPRGCELHAVTAAAIKYCDFNDGVGDGIIADPDSCAFDPYTMVGTEIECGGTTVKISRAAARVAEAVWRGPTTVHGTSLWYGFSPDIHLSGPMTMATTDCPEDGQCTCVTGFLPSTYWMRWFIAKNPKFDLTQISHQQFETMFNQSVKEFDGVMGTNNPDLARFRDAGGKMITVHGLADQLIPPKSVQEYYGKVLTSDPDARDYYRYFEAPGMAHCFTGKGAFPENVFEDLVAWVEEGRAPETLMARAIPEIQGDSYERPLCQYPFVARYDGSGDLKNPKSYNCAETHLSTTPIATVLQRTRKMLEEAMKTSNSRPLHDEV